MIISTQIIQDQSPAYDYKVFESLYDTYAPKAFGFIAQYTDTKEEAEVFLKDVFLKAWGDIKNFDEHTEKKIMGILLSVCKPLYKNKINAEN